MPESLGMIDPNALVPRPDRPLTRPPHPVQRQQRLMIVALAMLLLALGFVLYRDRDFWFPDAQNAEDESAQSPAATKTATTQGVSASAPVKKSRVREQRPRDSAVAPNASAVPITISARTVLPPLEVEVVAAGTHRIVRPGTNTVRVELQGETLSRSATASSQTDAATSIASNAAERVRLSDGTTDVVDRSVNPGYPMLARQMKVQGSVILQALIGRDGLIQDLHVLSGPPILATAAEEAVRQWHFKPHYQDGAAVETQTRITVNFTISTN